LHMIHRDIYQQAPEHGAVVPHAPKEQSSMERFRLKGYTQGKRGDITFKHMLRFDEGFLQYVPPSVQEFSER